MDADYDRPLAPRLETVYELWANARHRAGAFDPARSPLHRQMAFIVGAPRSGTTWLQQLLIVHPLITTGGESHLFCEGLPEIVKNFANPDETSHLSSWVSEAELLTMLRAFCDTAFAAQRATTRPDARIIVEKTPNHRQQSALQARIYPDAKYVHIVRDGRDSTASQRTLWGEWRSEFANPQRVAAQWVESVRDIRRSFGKLDYLELRYEDVVADTPAALARIFAHLELPSDAALCSAAAAFGKAPVNTAPNSGEVRPRKHRGNVLAERSVARAAGELLVEFGYATPADVERDKHLRTMDTMAFDLRESTTRGVRWLRRHAKRARPEDRPRPVMNASNPVFRAGEAIASAVAESNEASVRAQLAPTATFATHAGAADVARELVARYGGWRSTNVRAADRFALLTLVRDGQSRAAVRLEVTDGAVTAVDEL